MLFVLIPDSAFAQQAGAGQAITNGITGFIREYWTIARLICGLAGAYCFFKIVSNIFLKAEERNAGSIIFFVFGAILLTAAPVIVSNILGLPLFN